MNATVYRVFAFVVTVVMFLPANVFAALIKINEIAWMGAAVSANHEWIELYNSGAEPVDFTGWTLVAADDTPSISLQGSIVAGGYFLLERTSDDSVQGITANQIYTGALGNAGETLLLKNSSNDVVDSVAGGENWANIGGDNGTKETPQRTAYGWVTAAPTPRAATVLSGLSSSNSSSGTAETGGNISSTSTAFSSAAAPAPSSSVSSQSSSVGSPSIPQPSIVARAIVPLKGIVGAAALFSGEAKGLKGEPLLNARFRWSFGDGGSAEGQKVFYEYHYPGAYAVFLDVSSGEFSVTTRGEIAVVPANLRLSRVVLGNNGFIEIANEGAEEVNLSFWRLQNGGSFFSIPQNTVLLPKRAVPFPFLLTKLPFDTDDIALLYPNGTVAVRYEKAPAVPQKIAEPVPAVLVQTAAVSKQQKSSATPKTPSVVQEQEPVLMEKTAGTSTLAAASAAVAPFSETERSGNAYKWFSGVLALLLFGVAGFIVFVRAPEATDSSEAKKRGKEAEEYEIIE